MAIKGSLREASLPDVLQLLALGQKTGCLSISDRTNFGYIYFDRGRICFSSIVNRRDRLGDMLVAQGVVRPEEIEAALDTQREHPERRLGEILLEREALTRDELDRFIRAQIEEAVYFLFTWTHGTFSFDSGVAPDDRALLVSINPESLLLEGARRIDEWSQIEKRIPTFDIIFDLDRNRIAAADVSLTREQDLLLPLINGRRDVAELVDATGLGEFEVGQALYGLMLPGFLHKVGRSRAADEEARDARVEEHRNLGVAFYRAGMLEESTREFRRVFELRDEDVQARFYIGLLMLRAERWSEAAEAFRTAAQHPGTRPAIHHNLAYALERMGDFPGARAALEEAAQRGGGDDARFGTALGVLALKLGDARQADWTLTAARTVLGRTAAPASWFHYAALAAALVGDSPRAVALVREGIDAHPREAALHNTLAVLLEREGSENESLAALDRGLTENSELPQLWKNQGDWHYRAGRLEDASAAYQQAVRLDPALGGDVYFRLGNIRYQSDELEQASAYWERALELDSGHARARSSLDLLRAAVA